MSPVPGCFCSICRLEQELLNALRNGSQREFLVRGQLRSVSSFPDLILELRASNGDARSDELLSALFACRDRNLELTDSLLLLAFLPMLHRSVRWIARLQPALSSDDIAQQAVSTFLQVLVSEQLQNRTSHFAFAIARSVKRQLFRWAHREGSFAACKANGDATAFSVEATFERHALLLHFLRRCVERSLLTETEVDLLVQYKLDGTTGGEPAQAVEFATNAARQRVKRLVRKLRRLAG